MVFDYLIFSYPNHPTLPQRPYPIRKDHEPLKHWLK